ncbi:MAG: helix-turn-helix domain-containing protein [Oscillospiraceae bacterium]
MIGDRLKELRREKGYSLEFAAEKINVSRQTISKWESGETVPDVLKCKELADLYDISLDMLLVEEGENPEEKRTGKYLFGAVKVGERGQIVIPQRARKIFGIKPGDLVIVLGDINQGMAIVPANDFKEKIGLLSKLKDGEKNGHD